jgi:hypothetical protein
MPASVRPCCCISCCTELTLNRVLPFAPKIGPAGRRGTYGGGVQINMDDADFTRLVHGDKWADKAVYWADMLDRFEQPLGGPPSLKWKRAYWMGSYTAVILGKSFLTERGHGFEVVYDWNDDQDDDVCKGWSS